MPESPALAQIIKTWQPASRDDESKRAYFFLHLIGAHCLTRLQDFLAASQHGPTVSVPDVLRAVKFLVFVSSYLAVLESSDGKPYAWLMDWLMQVLAQLDEMLPDPPARDISKLLVAPDSQGITDVAIECTCLMLKLPSTDDQQSLATMLSEDRAYRNELLVMALTHPLESLRDHLAMFS